LNNAQLEHNRMKEENAKLKKKINELQQQLSHKQGLLSSIQTLHEIAECGVC